ncbi:MAG: long-chain-fatty-acid--CoA ligase [Caulobacteraceae bacterium]|nr:long-chain-fatty-acid--CoA ligase [Caulobacteraceae bacterium]
MALRLTQFLERNLLCQPDAVALVDGSRNFTWRDLDDRVSRLASALVGSGLVRGGRVAMLADNSHKYVEFYLAAAWAGAVAVPLNHRLADPEMSHVLADSGAEVLLVDRNHECRVDAILEGGTGMRRVIRVGEAGEVDDYETLLAAATPMEPAPAEDDDIIGIFYTGGTTGLPKGVMLTHKNMWASAWSFAIHVGIGPGSVSLCSGPLFHVSAMAALVPFLMIGGRVIVLPRFSTGGVIDAIERQGVTVMNGVPTMARMLLEDPRFLRCDRSSLRTVMFGGAPLPDALIDEFADAVPSGRMMPAYGMTELTACATILTDWPEARARGARRLRSSGQPVVGTHIRILDPSGRPVPNGELGEICVRGDIVMKGYWRRPDLTAATVRDGWMHTGDVGHMDDGGHVFIVDRLKDMIISGGENVYSAEVENVLALMPGVAECAVIGVPDERWGERVHAVVRFLPGVSASSAELIAHCRTRIAGYKAPRSVEIREAPLPLSAANKILKSELRRQWLEAHS